MPLFDNIGKEDSVNVVLMVASFAHLFLCM